METIEKFIGKKVIIRSAGAGIFFGTLLEAENSEGKMIVGIQSCRRLWFWDGAASLSQLATEGVTKPENCKFTVTVDEMVISDVVEIIPTTDKAVEIINSVKIWKV